MSSDRNWQRHTSPNRITVARVIDPITGNDITGAGKLHGNPGYPAIRNRRTTIHEALLALFFILAGQIAQPLYAAVSPYSAEIMLAENSAGTEDSKGSEGSNDSKDSKGKKRQAIHRERRA
jgi:hypothetical protein